MLTAAAHVADAMAAVRRRIQSLNTGPFSATPIAVEIGAPATFHPRDDGATPLVTIFVYRIEFDNAAYLSTPTGAQALRLHALLTAFCAAGVDRSESAGSFELRILSTSSACSWSIRSLARSASPTPCRSDLRRR